MIGVSFFNSKIPIVIPYKFLYMLVKFCTFKINKKREIDIGRYYPVLVFILNIKCKPTVKHFKQQVSAVNLRAYIIVKYIAVLKLLRSINKPLSVKHISNNLSIIGIKWCLCFLLPIVLFGTTLSAQTYNANPDLGNVKANLKAKLKDPFKINGGFALNSVFVNNTGLGATNQQPFTWIATANLNLRLFGYALPFSFTYSNRKVQYSNPNYKFNRFVLHPKYKSWTAHFGDISSSFTPYTLSGFQYTGGGLEYNKGKWQVQALYGRFMKAVKEDINITPSYKRLGWGTRMVYKDNGKKAGLSIFHAKDDLNSIPSPALEPNANTRPMAGTAFALEGAYPLLKNLSFDAEYSVSILTRDLRNNPNALQANTSLLKKLVGSPNSTTTIFHAIKTGFNYSFAQSAVGITYERVDPGYQTLGGYFFTNDFENITTNLSQNFWKGKLTATLNAGLQTDDLGNTKQSKLQRLVMAGNIGIRPSPKLTIGLTYSNLQSYTFVRTGFEQINQVTPYQNLDTLNFTQLSQNAGLNISYALQQSKEQSQSISFTGNFLESANKKGDIIRLGDATRFFNGSINHTIGLMAANLSITTGFNYSYNYAAQIAGTIWGPMVNVSKLFFKKILHTNYGAAYNSSSSLGKNINILNIRGGASATVAKKHNFNSSIIWQNKTGNGVAATAYLTATAGYSFSF